MAVLAVAVPSLEAATGRWKWSGSECYWDADDSGPDQCDPNAPPTGRWKWSSNACYFDPNDTGPDQCEEGQVPHGDMELTISGTHFKVDGQTRFLVFISHFDALRESSSNLSSDFRYLKSKGVDGIRIFPNWWRYAGEYDGINSELYFAQDTLIDPSGNLRSGPLTKLLEVLTLAKQWGLIVDLSFSAETVGDCPADNCRKGDSWLDISSLDMAEFRSGLAALATVLSNGGSAYKHVFFDIQNESDKNTNGPTNKRPLINYVTAVKNAVLAIHGIDPHIIVTASVSGDTLTSATKTFASGSSLDLIAWHEKRRSSWWSYTTTRVGELLSAGVPVYLQEPEPFGDDDWTLAGIKQNVSAAYSSGAAAWCFHTRSGFHLSDAGLESHLATAEKSFLDALVAELEDR
jgi:hypothetical protein